MKVLVLGLYAEGPTDYDFLPSVIQRTAEQVLKRHGQPELNPVVSIIKVAKGQRIRREESILLAAKEARNCHVLIVHSDADYPTPERARAERFEPGYKDVQQCNEKACKTLLPVIPVQAIEAWMLADHQLLLKEIGTRANARELGLPEKAKLVEPIAKPKERLEKAIQKACAHRLTRKQSIDIRSLYEPMGLGISLDRLAQVPSYQQFVTDLTNALKTLNLIQ